MRGPGGAFVAVSFQLLVGTLILMIYTFARYRIINRGYYRSTLWVLWPMLVLSTLMLPSALRLPGFALAGAAAMMLIAVYSQRPLLEWMCALAGLVIAGWLTYEIGVGMCSGDCLRSVLHVVAGTLVMGAVTHGMTLGHWYLNQARLPLDPLKEASFILFGALGASALIGVVTRAWLLVGSVPGGLFPIRASTYWWSWALLLVTTVFLGAMVYATVKSRSTQSATGLLYIAIVTALGAQFVLNLLAAT